MEYLLEAGWPVSDKGGMAQDDKDRSRALRKLDEFRREVLETPPDEVNADDLERRLQELLNEVGRAYMGDVLRRADTKAPTVEHGGQRWGNRRESPGTYCTRFGDVEVVRSIYSRGGGGPVLVPLDKRLGIVERRYTPATARLLTRVIAVMTSWEAEGVLEEAGVAQVSRSTLDRLPKAVAARYEKDREVIEESIREQDAVPEGATVVQASLDGVMVPQDGESSGPRGRKTTHPAPPRHETRYGAAPGVTPADVDGQDGRSWHEATVAALGFWDAEGNYLGSRYVARMPEPGQQTAVTTLDDELRAVLAERPDLDVSFASDGDLHQWAMLDGIAAGLPESSSRRVTRNLDFFHAASHLHDAATAAKPDAASATVLTEQWKATLKEHEDGVVRVLKSLRYHRDTASSDAAAEEIDACIDYVSTNASQGRMSYRASRDLNHPIGTGVIEAAAKTIVNVRMKRAGCRYDQHGGQTLLTFRASLYSGRFPALWRHLHDSYKGRVRELDS
jgi:hypothetical protein